MQDSVGKCYDDAPMSDYGSADGPETVCTSEGKLVTLVDDGEDCTSNDVCKSRGCCKFIGSCSSAHL